MIGSPCATLFITVLFLPQLTEPLQYQWFIKEQAAPDEAEAPSSSVSLLPLCAPESNSGRLTIPMSITSRF